MTISLSLKDDVISLSIVKKYMKRHQKELLLFIVFFIIFSLFVHWVGWGENSRLALTKSIVEEHNFDIDEYHNLTGDRIVFKNHYYSDKAPGASFIAVPLYFLIDKTIEENETVEAFIKGKSSKYIGDHLRLFFIWSAKRGPVL